MKKYLYSEYADIEALWFTVPKAGTKTIHEALNRIGINFQGEKFRILEEHHVDFFKFCFTRNPWDRTLSVFKDKTKKVWEKGGWAEQLGAKADKDECLKVFKQWKDSSFKKFVFDLEKEDLSIDRHIQEQHLLFPIDEIDFFGKIENFQKDFDLLCSKLSLKNVKLSRKNNTNHIHYSKYYDPEMIEIIREKYSKDIQLFQYEFNYEK